MNSKLTGTTMSKISCEGVVALKRAGLVLICSLLIKSFGSSKGPLFPIIVKTAQTKVIYTQHRLFPKHFQLCIPHVHCMKA